MRIRLALATFAPLALGLAACGDDTDMDERIVEPGTTTGVDVELPNQPVSYPEIPLNARTSVDYAGTYEQSMPGGARRSLTLNDDDTYTMTDETGAETSGSYNWYSDNSRILIKRNGQNEVYGVADGYVYRLPDENAPITGPRDAASAYTRVSGPGQVMGGATGAGTMQDTAANPRE